MQPSNERIDSHVHFYTSADLERVSGGLPYQLPAPHPLTEYLDRLIESGVTPVMLNNVHLSILPDSENVFASFSELARLQDQNPARYGMIKLVGTIKADPEYATVERLSHPQIVGVRIVLHDARPDTVVGGQFSSAAWLELYARLRVNQHVHIYAKEAETGHRVLQQVPENVRVVIDHLGSCHSERGAEEPAYLKLLAEAKRRGNVWFKGPGYRTDTDPLETAKFVSRIVREVGCDRILLEATDAPHVGMSNSGEVYKDLFDVAKAYSFVDEVARSACLSAGLSERHLLQGQLEIIDI
ncbi:amidohydrolase family protein [Pseudomonas sp. NPDC090592]|uniref:amidohydrolase family protein n=1 Tax=Pseudomonas sp. NPDC090592 TaxID=3364480 RepID=UPI00383B48A3